MGILNQKIGKIWGLMTENKRVKNTVVQKILVKKMVLKRPMLKRAMVQKQRIKKEAPGLVERLGMINMQGVHLQAPGLVPLVGSLWLGLQDLVWAHRQDPLPVQAPGLVLVQDRVRDPLCLVENQLLLLGNLGLA